MMRDVFFDAPQGNPVEPVRRQAWRRVIAIVLPVAMAVALGACRDEEQGRSLHYEKGTYQGAPDESIDPATLSKLQQRVNSQRAP